MAEAVSRKHSSLFWSRFSSTSLYFRQILTFFSALTVTVWLLLQTYIHDAHLSNCETVEDFLSQKYTDAEDTESVCQRKQFSAFKVTKITSQKVSPLQDLVGFQSFPMTRPTVCHGLCPCSINLLVLNHSVIRHKISSMCSMSTTSMTWWTTKRNKIDVVQKINKNKTQR